MLEFDVAVLGGGPAGTHAALAAASAGLRVALFDENPRSDSRADARVLGASNLTTFFSHPVWSVTTGYRIDAAGPDGPTQSLARALIVACGTTDRVVPFEGWTTPGVIGLAAASMLLKSPVKMPGDSLVAGCGPLIAAIAATAIKAGCRIAAIADLAGTGEWARRLPAMAARPDLLLQGLGWWRTIRRGGTLRYARHSLVRVEPEGKRLRATLAPCDAAGRMVDAKPSFVLADRIVVSHGLCPTTEITRLLRARHRYSSDAGGWIVAADEHGRTSRALLYVAGDAAGTAGAAAAKIHGTLAGLACASDLCGADASHVRRRIELLRRKHRRAARVGRAMGKLMALRPAHVEGLRPETIVCRCEGVTRLQIDAACDAGAGDMNQLKAWTRCGMGECQGRICGDIAGDLLMLRTGAASREQIGYFTARTPLRPVTVEALTGNFLYEDIAIPNAAPL